MLWDDINKEYTRSGYQPSSYEMYEQLQDQATQISAYMTHDNARHETIASASDLLSSNVTSLMTRVVGCEDELQECVRKSELVDIVGLPHISQALEKKIQDHIDDTNAHPIGAVERLSQVETRLDNTPTRNDLLDYYTRIEIDNKQYLQSVPEYYITRTELHNMLSDEEFMAQYIAGANIQVDSTAVMVGNASFYLSYENGVLKLNTYVPIAASISLTPNIWECDTFGEAVVSVTTTGAAPTEMRIYGTGLTGGASMLPSQKYTVNVQKNVTSSWSVQYTDGTAPTKSIQVTSSVGYKVIFGTTPPTSSNFATYSQGKICKSKASVGNFIITANGNAYGYFAMPQSWYTSTTDFSDGNNVGGWVEHGTFTVYSNNTVYKVYRTKNAGIGSITWKLT